MAGIAKALVVLAKAAKDSNVGQATIRGAVKAKDALSSDWATAASNAHTGINAAQQHWNANPNQVSQTELNQAQTNMDQVQHQINLASNQLTHSHQAIYFGPHS